MMNPDYEAKVPAGLPPLGTLIRIKPDQWNRDRRPTTIVGVNHLGQYITQRKQGAPYKVWPVSMCEEIAHEPKPKLWGT